MSNILVTGAAGFVGFEVTTNLLAEGHTVVGIDNYDETLNESASRRAKISSIQNKNFKFLELDLVQSDLSGLIDDADFIFHFAATPGLVPSWSHFSSYSYNNISASFKLAEAIGNSRTWKNVIVASTSSVYGKNAIGDETAEINPTSPYGITKFASEQIFQTILGESTHNLLILRLFSVFGPNQREDMAWQKIIRSIHMGTPFPLTAGPDHTRSCTYVGDIADLCNNITLKPFVSGTFNICGSYEINILEGIRLIEHIMGKQLNYIKSEPRRGDQIKTSGNSDLAQRLLSFNPVTNFEIGIRNQIRAFFK